MIRYQLNKKLALHNVTAVILAGGKSSRFDSNKALAPVNGKPVIQIIRDRLCSFFRRVILITNTFRDYAFLGLPMFRDTFPGRGPLGGLHTALEVSFTPWLFVTSCDVPYFSVNLYFELARYHGKADVFCYLRSGFIEPLPGLFNRDILPEIYICMKSGDYSLQNLIRICNTQYVPFESFMSSLDPKMLLNCNTEEDHIKFLQLSQSDNILS